MLNSIYINNFRVFTELAISGLARVNLIVGKNNSGKSCFLEAIQIYASNGSPSILSDLVSARDENWEHFLAQNEGLINSEIDNPLRHLFRGYHFPSVGENFIEIGPIDDHNRRIRIGVVAYEIQDDPDGRRVRVPVTQPPLSSDFVDLQLAIAVITGADTKLLSPVISDARDPFFRRRLYPYSREGAIKFQLVPTRGLDDDKISTLWDNINLTGLDEEIISCLQIIVPSINGLAFVGEGADPKYPRTGRKRVPIVRCSGSDDRFTLKTMGDGITKLLHIALALANAKNGYLLIDEFENGLHWSAQRKLWEIIFRLANRLNVQVFATTHSRDCIAAFSEASQAYDGQASFFRLEINSEGESEAVTYSINTLGDAIDSAVEMR